MLAHKALEAMNLCFSGWPLSTFIINSWSFTASTCLVYLAVLVLYTDCLLLCSVRSMIKSCIEPIESPAKCLEIHLYNGIPFNILTLNIFCGLPVLERKSSLAFNSDFVKQLFQILWQVFYGYAPQNSIKKVTFVLNDLVNGRIKNY